MGAEFALDLGETPDARLPGGNFLLIMAQAHLCLQIIPIAHLTVKTQRRRIVIDADNRAEIKLGIAKHVKLEPIQQQATSGRVEEKFLLNAAVLVISVR